MLSAFLSLVGGWLSALWGSRRQRATLTQAAEEHVENAVMAQQLEEVRDANAAQTAARAGGDPALDDFLRRSYVD